MILNYQHHEVELPIECELEFQPADHENGINDDDFEIVSAKIKDVDISGVLSRQVINEIKQMAFESKGYANGDY